MVVVIVVSVMIAVNVVIVFIVVEMNAPANTVKKYIIIKLLLLNLFEV